MVKGNVVPFHIMKAYRLRINVAPFLLNLHTRWNCAVSLCPDSLS